jgi:hypothetical protein
MFADAVAVVLFSFSSAHGSGIPRVQTAMSDPIIVRRPLAKAKLTIEGLVIEIDDTSTRASAGRWLEDDRSLF